MRLDNFGILLVAFILICCMNSLVSASAQGVETYERSDSVHLSTVKIVDAITNTGVAYAMVTHSVSPQDEFYTDHRGVLTLALDGRWVRQRGLLTVVVIRQGYQAHKHTFYPADHLGDTVAIAVMPAGKVSRDIVVETQRSKYSARNNPAVDLMDTLILNKRIVPEEFSYRAYDKLNLALANFDLNNRALNRLFPFFRRYVTASKLDGKWVLPISLRESVTDLGVNPTESSPREVIRYRKRTGIDQNIDDGTMTQSLEEIFPRIDINDNDIKLLNNRFVSPLSTSAKRFYKFYLTDTIISRGRVVRVIQYYPFNPRTFCFRGRLFVTMDDEPKVIRSEMEVPKTINLNFVNELKISQTFKEEEGGRWVVDEEDMNISFSLFRKLLSLYAEHTRKYDRYNFSSPDTLLTRHPVRVRNLSRTPEARRYGEELESDPFLASDHGLKEFLGEVRSIPLYRIIIDAAEMISGGYVRTDYIPGKIYGGSKFDIGPLSTLYGQNNIEGLRLRLGGRSTAFLSPHFFISGYGAYGFKDKEWKYSVQATFTPTAKRYFLDEYPKQDITLKHEYDLYTPGQMFDNDNKDNILRNIGTAYLTSRSYRKTWHLRYRQDFHTGLSVDLYGQHAIDRPTGSLSYVKVRRDSTLIRIPRMCDVSVGIKLRYAPGERVYEGNRTSSDRRHIQRDFPIFTLKHETSLKALGGDFAFHRTEVGIEQRLWLSSFGNIDYRLTAGKIWNSVPFPLLYTPPTNSAIAYNDFAFQLLKPMEYIGDEYATLFASYHLRGLILNFIPLINRLHAREVITFNALYGNTTTLNRAETSSELFLLPNLSTEMRGKFYAEIGFGLENIFRILRIDVFKRLTPPGPFAGPKYGIKGALRLDF